MNSRNISIEENYIRLIPTVGPNFIKLQVEISDWGRFVAELNKIRDGGKIHLRDNSNDKMIVLLEINNNIMGTRRLADEG